MKRHSFHPQTAVEYADAVEFYRQIDPALAERFFLEIERVILAVRQHPEWYWLFDPPARRHFSPCFPYACIYLDQPDRVWIVAIMHMKQKPAYWHGRID